MVAEEAYEHTIRLDLGKNPRASISSCHDFTSLPAHAVTSMITLSLNQRLLLVVVDK